MAADLINRGLRAGWLVWIHGQADPLVAITADGELPDSKPGMTTYDLYVLGLLRGLFNYPGIASKVFLTPLGIHQPRAENSILLTRFLAIDPKHRKGLLEDAKAGNLSGEGLAPGGDRKQGKERVEKRARKANIHAGLRAAGKPSAI
jgi:hypothetical protein